MNVVSARAVPKLMQARYDRSVVKSQDAWPFAVALCALCALLATGCDAPPPPREANTEPPEPVTLKVETQATHAELLASPPPGSLDRKLAVPEPTASSPEDDRDKNRIPSAEEFESRRRNTSPEERLAKIQDLYRKGSSNAAKASWKANVRFSHWNTAVRLGLEVGAQRFEQRKDGLWVFRRDEFNRIFALSAYRLALEDAKQNYAADVSFKGVETQDYEAVYNFCYAICAAPEVVKTALKRFPLTGAAIPLFDRAKRFCTMEGGFRARKPSQGWWVPSEDWWVRRPKLTEEELLALMRRYYQDGSYHDVKSLWNAAKGKAVYEQEDGAWVYRDNEINTLAALAYFRYQAAKPINNEYSANDARDGFCIAIKIASRAVSSDAKEFPLSAKARGAFERAKRECRGSRFAEAPFPDP